MAHMGERAPLAGQFTAWQLPLNSMWGAVCEPWQNDCPERTSKSWLLPQGPTNLLTGQ